MSTGSKEPEDFVKDGVEEEAPAGDTPVPREEGQAAAQGTGATEQQAATGSRETNKAAGPAQEQDEQAGDDRGLTTDSSPD
jgi:hypothetical protein